MIAQTLEKMRRQLMTLSPQQLMQYMQNPSPGTPPSWLVLSVLKEQGDQRQAAMQPMMPPPPTVAQQVVQKAVSPPSPQSAQGIGAAPGMSPPVPSPMPSPMLPPPGMAQGGVASLPYEDHYVGGGIVSFAEGGDMGKKQMKATDEYWKAMAQQTGPWSFALKEAIAAPRRAYAAPLYALGGLGWTRDKEGKLIRKFQDPEYLQKILPFSEEARGARAEQAVQGDVETMSAPTPGENTSAAQLAEAPYYLSAPAVAPQYLRAPEEDQTKNPKKIQIQELPEQPSEDELPLSKVLASLNAPVSGQGNAAPVTEKFQHVQERAVPTREQYLQERRGDEAAFGVDREAYFKKKEAGVAEKAKDVEEARTRGWALPLMQASLSLMGQSGSLARGISNVAPILGTGLEKGFEQVTAQKALLDKSKEALEDARYAASVGDMQGYVAKREEAKNFNEQARIENIKIDNTALAAKIAQNSALNLAALQNAGADRRTKITALTNLYTNQQRIRAQRENLEAQYATQKDVATIRALAAAASQGQNIVAKVAANVDKRLSMDPNLESDIALIIKNNPKMSRDDAIKLKRDKAIKDDMALIASINHENKLGSVLENLTAGGAGLSVTPMPDEDTGADIEPMETPDEN